MVIKTVDVKIAEVPTRDIEWFRSLLRPVAYGLWNGTFDVSQFLEAFEAALVKGLSEAWFQGAESQGIDRDDMSDAERSALQSGLFDEFTHTEGLATYIDDNNRDSGGAWSVIVNRLEYWVGRWNDFYGRAKVLAKLDAKFIWNFNPQKDHCIDCVRLNGKVKRSSQWRAWVESGGAWPKSYRLACHGKYCGCSLDPTDLPLSKGKLPRLAGA